MRAPTFGPTLRAWRHAVSPVDVGLTTDVDPRRTPGLRREELARLAGVSPEYLQRLEQDRAHPGPDVVRALAKALDVGRSATAELLHLAGHAPRPEGCVPRGLTPGAVRLLDLLTEQAAGVYDASWTWVTGNAAWSALFAHLDAPAGREGNVVWLCFAGGIDPLVVEDRNEHEIYLVKGLRRASQRYPDDPDVHELVTSLRKRSPRFAERWDGPEPRAPRGHRGVVTGTRVGDLELEWDVLSIQDTDLRIVVLSAAPGGSDERRLIELLDGSGVVDEATRPVSGPGGGSAR